jgi:hypothetical protein
MLYKSETIVAWQALFISPKNPKSSRPFTKLHVQNTRFERVSIPNLALEPDLLVLVTVGKVTVSVDEATRFLKDKVKTWERGEDGVKSTTDVFESLRKRGLVSGAGKWDDVRASAVQFAERKRLKGRWETDWNGEEGAPTLDVMIGKESVP